MPTIVPKQLKLPELRLGKKEKLTKVVRPDRVPLAQGESLDRADKSTLNPKMSGQFLQRSILFQNINRDGNRDIKGNRNERNQISLQKSWQVNRQTQSDTNNLKLNADKVILVSRKVPTIPNIPVANRGDFQSPVNLPSTQWTQMN